MPVEVPASFLAMPRWWYATPAERRWLGALPGSVDAWCARWGLDLDGPPVHGSNALVVPVHHSGRSAVLRLAPPSDDVAALANALELWRGHGAVELLEADPAAGALLLERLGPESLAEEPLDKAIPQIGRTARRLAISVPDRVAARLPHTSQIVAERTPQMRPQWLGLDRPFPEQFIDAAEAAAARILTGTREPVAVNGDLHFNQVLRGRSGWQVVDPVLLCGDAERTAVETLWHRADEMTDTEIPLWFALLVEAAELDPARARDWATWRVTDYALWGLQHGLTEDPPRCRRVLEALTV